MDVELERRSQTPPGGGHLLSALPSAERASFFFFLFSSVASQAGDRSCRHCGVGLELCAL